MREPDQSGWNKWEREAYAKAEREIEKARAEGWEHLTLFNMSFLPPALVNLTQIETLTLQGGVYTDLSLLSKLEKLRALNIGYGGVADLASLSSLVNLSSLKISGSEISNLEPLSGLASLSSLSVHAPEVSDLTPLSSLMNLSLLSIDDSGVSDLTPLSSLMNLSSLHAGNSEVSDLTPLSGLTKLTRIEISHSQVLDLKPLRGLMPGLIEAARQANGGGLEFRNTPATKSDPELARIAELSSYARMLALRDYLFPEDAPPSASAVSAPKAPQPPRSPAKVALTRTESGELRLEARPNPPSSGAVSPNPARLEGLLRQAGSVCKTLIAFGAGMNAGPGFAAALEGYREEAGLAPEKVLPDTLEMQISLAATALDLRLDHPDAGVVKAELLVFREGAHRELMAQHFPAMAEQEAAADASAMPPDAPVHEPLGELVKELRWGEAAGVVSENIPRLVGAMQAKLAEPDYGSPEIRRDKKHAAYGLAGLAAAVLAAAGLGLTALGVAADLHTFGLLAPIIQKFTEVWRVLGRLLGF